MTRSRTYNCWGLLLIQVLWLSQSSRSNNQRVLSVVTAFATTTPIPRGPVPPTALLLVLPENKKEDGNETMVAPIESQIRALESRGFQVKVGTTDSDTTTTTDTAVTYRYNRATGMLQRLGSTTTTTRRGDDATPAWIPLEDLQENLLVQRGWSFLDNDENEPLSSFDIDAANAEGTYQPQWKLNNDNGDQEWKLSPLGWDVTPMSPTEVQEAVEKYVPLDSTRNVLLHGATDARGVKQTNNGYVFRGTTISDFPPGVFTCAVSGIPLFTTADLLPTTASADWLSFTAATVPDGRSHVKLVPPRPEAEWDRRTEVVDRKSGCHLGHYFEGDSYCINASCLDFFPLSLEEGRYEKGHWTGPASYRQWETVSDDSPSGRLLRQIVDEYAAVCGSSSNGHLVLGGGCFWHVEAALRRLPGVVDTTVGYAGGSVPQPTYEHVCSQERSDGYAEVVQVTFDPNILSPRELVDCFLAMHDPTKVRAHGKHAPLTGQYRSCIFVQDASQLDTIQQAIHDCQVALNKEVCTQVETGEQFWKAEDRHQRYEERRDDRITETETLSLQQWLNLYGRRKPSVMGTAQTLEESVAESRFYI